jgi:hypothetical protein
VVVYVGVGCWVGGPTIYFVVVILVCYYCVLITAYY